MNCKKGDVWGPATSHQAEPWSCVTGVFGGHFLPAETSWCAQAQGGHQLPSAVPLSASEPAWSGHIQACGMQPTKGLKALKCSFSERPAFLKCQRSWKRQLAPLPAAQAKQPGLNMAERCLCRPQQAGGPGTASSQAPLHPPQAEGLVGSQAKKPKHPLPPMFSNQCRKREISEPSRAVCSLCQQTSPFCRTLVPLHETHLVPLPWGLIAAWNSKYAQRIKPPPRSLGVSVLKGYQC